MDALIDLGGIAPADTPVDHRRDVLTARTYVHPALDGRVVVSLAAEPLGAAEDLAMEFLGFAGVAGPVGSVPVGVVRRQALGFPAWALVHDPANGRHALGLVKEMERSARLALAKPGRARAEFEAMAERLAAAVPHFLPSFYEQAARAFLAAENTAVASVLFTKAREAERAYALAVDEDDQAATFLEFALAGAVSAKVMTGYARQLAERCEPVEAYARFRRICVERVAAGAPPYFAMLADLRKLARPAGLDNAAEDAALARELLTLTAVTQAALGFWNAYRPALARAAKHDPGIRELLLRLMPALPGSENHIADDGWLELLEECGAVDLLAELPAPGSTTVPTTSITWLADFARHTSRPWDWRWRTRHADKPRGTKLPGLVERIGLRLVSEQAAGADDLALCTSREADLGLIDQCLAMGVRVADPTPDFGIDLGAWLASGATRDLVALAADARIRPHLTQAVADLIMGNGNRSGNGERPGAARSPNDVAQQLVDCAGLRGVLHDYLAERAELTATCGLADLEAHAQFWRRISNPALLAANPEAARRAAGTDVAGVLGHALRAGIFDEYGWPALEAACADLAKVAPGTDPYQPKPGPATPAGGVAEGATKGSAGGVAGSAAVSASLYGSFHRIWKTVPQWPYLSVAAADTVAVVGAEFGGTSLVDPHAIGTEAGVPALFAAGADEGELLPEACWLRLAVPGTKASPLGHADGLLGSRTRRSADGTQTCTGIDGRRAVLGRLAQGGEAVGVMDVPGSPNRLTVVERDRRNGTHLVDGSKRVAVINPGARAATYSRGTWCMPPVEFWHFLTVRDEAGSAALRNLTDATARELLDRTAGFEYSDAVAVVRELVPEITNARLVSGITGYLGVAAASALQLTQLGKRLAQADTGGSLPTPVPAQTASPADTSSPTPDSADATTAPAPALVTLDDHMGRTFGRARRGLCGGRIYQGLSLPDAIDGLQDFERILTGPDAAGSPATPVRPRTRLYQYLSDPHWTELAEAMLTAPALAYRALSPATGQAERTALAAFLSALAGSALAAPGAAIRLVVLAADPADPAARRDPPNWTVADTDNGRAVIIGTVFVQDRKRHRALEYSRDGAFTDIPGWKIVQDRRAQPWTNPGGLAEYRQIAEGREPFALDPKAAETLSALTGLSRAEAAVLLAALPTQTAGLGDPIPADLPDLLGLKPAEIRLAAATFEALDDRTRARLVAVLLPGGIEELWQTGPDLDAAASHWIALRGRQDPLPEWLLAAATKATADKEAMVRSVRGLLNPDEARWLGADFQAADIPWSARALLWLCYVLPDGDPLRERLPRALAVLRERLADPDLQTEATWAHLEPQPLADLLGLEAVETDGNLRIGPFSVTARHVDWCSVRLHPADLSGPADPALAYLAGISPDNEYPDALRLLLGNELPTLIGAGQPEEGAQPYPAQDPSRSVPHLVAEAAETLAISQDAATLYLMLLALPDPTDRNQAAWTGWKAARLKAAQAELAATDLVVAGRRRRAGRGLFLPGAWNELASPHLPLEAWKGNLVGAKADGSVTLGIAAPRIPVAELYALVWRRVQAGDVPRYLGLAARAR